MDKEKALIVVYAGSSTDANLVKNLLEKTEINTFLQDEIIGAIAPWAIAAGGVKVMVEEKDFDKAQEIVQDFLDSNNT